MDQNDRLRELPAVHEVLERLFPALARFPRALVAAETRRALDELRAEILGGSATGPPVEARVEQALAALERPSLRRVVNATGVVLHTNLGRAPLGPIHVLSGYSNLEYDLAAGRRGQRDVHAAGLLERLLGAPGIAVNNNAAAIFLALNELAAGGEVVVSRGELIEIGDGFRIPDIMARSGASVREVGTTNRTANCRLPRGHRRAHQAAAARPSQQLSHLGLHRAARTARAGGLGTRARRARL